MTNEEAIGMLKAKLECITRDVSGRDDDCNRMLCGECRLNYEKGTMGEQKEYLRMAIKALEKEPCEDAISRQAVLDMKYTVEVEDMWHMTQKIEVVSVSNIKELPLVTQQPKTGRWILYRDHKNMMDYPQCDNCGVIIKLPLPIDNLNYCPNCGQPKMQEVGE